MGRFYEKEETIYETIDSCLSKIKSSYNKALEDGKRFKIYNPVDDQEDFTDSWTDASYRSFYAFIEDLYAKWEYLKKNFEQSGEKYVGLFGEKLYRKSIQDQVKILGKYSKSESAIASGLLLNNEAKTDRSGNVNKDHGVKNTAHHNYGGAY